MAVDYLIELEATSVQSQTASAITGILAGFDEDRQPLVIYDDRLDSVAVRARSTVDLHAAHIGQPVVLVLERGDAQRPIVIGCLRSPEGLPLSEQPGRIEVDADGQRVIVTAKRQLVLRCGRASITLTCNGKILIDGAYVSSNSSGVNRVKGGSVQLN